MNRDDSQAVYPDSIDAPGTPRASTATVPAAPTTPVVIDGRTDPGSLAGRREAQQREAARQQARERAEEPLRRAYLRAVDEEQEQRAASTRAIAIGVIAMLIGILVTVTTYSHASASGGTYLVAWGPIVFGFIQIVRGLAGR